MADCVYEVFIQINEKNYVTNVNSSIVIKDTNNWIKIDEGLGDRYTYAQSKYFSKPLTDENGVFNFKYSAQTNTVLERTAAEIQSDINNIPTPELTDTQRIRNAEDTIEMILTQILPMLAQ